MSHENSTLTSNTPYARSLFVGHQKYGDEVKADALLGLYRPPQIHYQPDSRPSYRQFLVRPSACTYTLLPTNEMYILLCFLALLIVDRRIWLSVCLPVTMQLDLTYVSFMF